MCVNPLVNRQMCQKDGQEFGSLWILYKHTHAHTISTILQNNKWQFADSYECQP